MKTIRVEIDEMKKLFNIHFYRWGLWYRLRGRGYSFSFNDKLAPLFSERYGFRKVYRFWKFKIIKLPKFTYRR